MYPKIEFFGHTDKKNRFTVLKFIRLKFAIVGYQPKLNPGTKS